MTLKRLWILAGATVTLCISSVVATADMVSSDRILDQATANQDRARIQAILDRKDAGEKLLAMGIDIDVVKERVAGLTDRETHELVQKFDTLPAGGETRNKNLIAILLIVLLVVLLV